MDRQGKTSLVCNHQPFSTLSGLFRFGKIFEKHKIVLLSNIFSFLQIKADFASVSKVNLDKFLPKWLEVEPKVICLFSNEKKKQLSLVVSCVLQYGLVFIACSLFFFAECQAEKSHFIFMGLPSLLPNGLRRSIKTLPTEESIRNRFLQVFPVTQLRCCSRFSKFSIQI